MPEPRHHLFTTASSGMVVFGMILALPGTVIGVPEFVARFHLTLADRGVFIATLFGGLLAGSLLSGGAIDRFGYQRSIAASAAAIAVLLPAFALVTAYPLALTALAGVGLSSATLNTAANALSSELFPEERGRRMTILSLAVSIGGLLLPMATAAAASLVSWKAVVIGGGVWSAAIAIAALMVAAPPAHVAAPSLGSLRGFLRQRGFFHVCLLVGCGAANEGAFAGWTSSYLAASGFSAVAATWGLSSHWFGLLIGRALLAGRVDRGKRAALIRAALAGGACLLLMIAWPTRPVLLAGPFAGGVAIAVIVPTALAFAGERHRGNSGMLFGVLLTMAQIGAMVLPPLVGTLADVTSLRVGLLLAVANALLIAWLAWDVEHHRPTTAPRTDLSPQPH